MKISDHTGDFSNVESCSIFREAFLSIQMKEQFSSIDTLHDQTQSITRGERTNQILNLAIPRQPCSTPRPYRNERMSDASKDFVFIHGMYNFILEKSDANRRRRDQSEELTLVITRLFRSIFIAKIRWVVLSRHRTTLPNVPRPRIFKYSKSLICYAE